MRHSFSLFALLANFLFADPQGFQLIAGDANAPVDNGAGITIQSGHQAIIQWDIFSIDEQRMVRFDQLDGNSAVLNRVMGGAESQLMGSLSSNGKVYLINPSGVLIGPNGRIETAGFIASTADVLNDDFLKGQELLFGDVGPGKIVHLGVIECLTGDVTLLAKVIDAPGDIHAGGGTVLLLQPKGASDIFIDTGEECALHQSGRIEALKI
ncbi:MAG TPA: filamentous hemagglutinin N-terminal domain-containing protein, partial [Chlamydiales bacterium]|nr:filamentous hemagglutinin N-terminal domain-containing protein [Chlamydiales bacterium]